MSLKVGELVAYIRADGTQFDRTIDESGRRFGGFGRAVDAGTQAVARSFAAITAAGVGLATAVFKVGADYNRLQQSSRAALTTLLGSAEAANAQMDKLDAFAKQSPFAKQVFITAQQQLLGFGVAADRVLPTLDAIQNAVAAVGGSNEQVSQVTYALAQMQGQGKLTGETLNQLGQYGIDAATVLGQQLGKTGGEIRELASKPGGIPVDQVWDPLVTGLMQRFGGATANIKLQFDGAKDRIKGAWRDVGSILAAPFIDPKGGGRAVEWANKIADILRALEQKARPLVDLIVARFTPALDAVTPALDRIRSGTNAWDLSKINGQLDVLARYAAPVAAVSGALFAMGTTNLPVLSTLGISGLNPVVAGLAALVAASPGLRAVGSDFLSALAPLLPVLGQLAVLVVDTAMAAGETLTPALGEVLQAAAPLIVILGTQLAGALTTVLGYVVPLAEAMAELPAPVLLGAAAFVGVAVVLPKLVAGFQALAAAAVSTGNALKAAFIGSPVGLAITAIATAVAIFVTRQAEAETQVRTLAETLDLQTAAITENTRAHVYNRLEQAGVIEAAKELGLSLDRVVDAALGGTQATKSLNEEYERATERTRELARGGLGAFAEGTAEATRRSMLLSEVLVETGAVADDVAESQGRVRDQIQAGIGPTDNLTAATGRQVDKLKELTDAQQDAASASISLREAQIRATEAQNQANTKVAEGTAVTRDATGAVDANAESTLAADRALLDLVGSQNTLTDSMRRNNASARDLDTTIRQQREAFMQTAQQMGYTRAEAQSLATQYGLIPRNVTTQLTADASQAQRTVSGLINLYNGTRIRLYVDAQGGTSYTVPGTGVKFNRDGGIVKAFAEGGFHGLTPMDAVAQMVPPNTWRVVGDRARDVEAYIPLDKSVRSYSILDQAAERMGRRIIPMAAGGVTGPASTPNVSWPDSLVAVMTDQQIATLAAAIVTRADTASVSAVRDAQHWGVPR